MNTDEPLVDKEYLLEKFPGKGGWTYAQIPEILPAKNAPFGWVRVRGTIDDYEIRNYNLMPMGNGKLFLPVKAEIRKKIEKNAGDFVRVKLFVDDTPTEIPEELKICLLDEPNAFETFLTYSTGEQKMFIEWIYSAKREETRIDRIARTITKIVNGKKFIDKK